MLSIQLSQRNLGLASCPKVFGMQPGAARHQTTNLAVSIWPALQPPRCTVAQDRARWSKRIHRACMSNINRSFSLLVTDLSQLLWAVQSVELLNLKFGFLVQQTKTPPTKKTLEDWEQSKMWDSEQIPNNNLPRLYTGLFVLFFNVYPPLVTDPANDIGKCHLICRQANISQQSQQHESTSSVQPSTKTLY